MCVRITFAFLALGIWTGCSDADTLGEEAPREVVITGTPTFTNGIGELMALKCGYCHAVPAPAIAPDDVPGDLDLTRYATDVIDGQLIRGADSVGRWLADGLLDHEVAIYVDFIAFPQEVLNARRMPLDYGTQLTDAERGHLLAWSANGSPRDESPEPEGDAGAGETTYRINCAGCHGGSGEGVNAFVDGSFDPDLWYGPPIRRNAATTAKIKSMFLHKSVPLNGLQLEPMADSDAADIRAFLQSVRP